MKALSIQQPFASMIIAGIKDVEYRCWSTSLRGKIAIHAGKKLDKIALKKLNHDLKEHFTPSDFPAGCIIGTVEITDCERYAERDYGFILSNPVEFETPIPYRGQLGFFDVTV